MTLLDEFVEVDERRPVPPRPIFAMPAVLQEDVHNIEHLSYARYDETYNNVLRFHKICSAVSAAHPLYENPHSRDSILKQLEREALSAYADDNFKFTDHAKLQKRVDKVNQQITRWAVSNSRITTEEADTKAKSIYKLYTDNRYDNELLINICKEKFNAVPNLLCLSHNERTLKWLRRQIRKTTRRAREASALLLRQVGAGSTKYISNFTNVDRRHQLELQDEYLKKTFLHDADSDYKTSLFDVAKTAEQKIAEVLCFTDGLEKLAKFKGLKPYFLTLTTPAKYHANPAIGEDAWTGELPPESQAFLMNKFRLFRAQMAKNDIDFMFLRVAEPHKDETAHWHIVYYIDDKDRAEVEHYIDEYFGHSDKAVRLEEPKTAIKATSYMFKYIQKTLNAASADEVDAWRATWQIRAFAFGGIGKGAITKWREIRRIKVEPAHIEIKKLWMAATKNNSFEFFRLLNIIDLKILREEKTHIDTSTGEILGTSKKTIGITIPGECVYLTHTQHFEKINKYMNKKDKVTLIHNLPRESKAQTKPKPRTEFINISSSDGELIYYDDDDEDIFINILRIKSSRRFERWETCVPF